MSTRNADAAKVSGRLGQLWEKFRPLSMQRIEVIRQAAASLRAGKLSRDLLQRASGEAHKIAGSAGSFGFEEISRSARRLELLLEAYSAGSDAIAIIAEAEVLTRLMEDSFVLPPPPSP